MKQKFDKLINVGAIVFILILATGAPVAAHIQPDGANWIMTDWMFYSFFIFAGTGLVTFLVLFKRGYFRDLEKAKYHILTLVEDDYYTPDWAKDDMEDTDDLASPTLPAADSARGSAHRAQ